MRIWPLIVLATMLGSCGPGDKELSMISPQAAEHVGLVIKAREAAVDKYIEEKAWIGLTKPQMEFVLRQHGFAGPFRYGPVYEDWWGKNYDEALFFERQIDDLWILFRNGKVAQVGTIYRE